MRRVASRFRPRRAVVTGVAAVVILAAAGIGAYAATRPSGSAYRTGLVEVAGVTRTLAETGTAVPATSATASFAKQGTVASVAVKAGQTVTAGQTLATLDQTPLVAALDAAKQTTAEAQLALTQAEDGTLTQAVGGTGGSRSATGATTAVTSGSSTVSLLATATTSTALDVVALAGPGTGSRGTSTSGLIAAVTGGQQRVDADLAAARALLAAAVTACAPTTTPTATASPTPTATPTATPTTTPAPPSPGVDPSAPASRPATSPPAGTPCLDAEQTLLRAQQRVAGDESALASAEASLDAALVASSSSAAATSGGQATNGPSGGQATNGSAGSGSTSTGSGTTATAAQLAAYQAKVDAAEAAQAVAQQDLQMATLVSPISGTVLSVGLTAGSSAGNDGILVSAPDGMVFTAAVPVATVPQIAVGQAVSLVRDGTAAALAGTVVAVAAVPDSSGDYAVTVGLTTASAGIRSGSTASMTISLAGASNVLTVPTSAITTIGSLHVVRLLSGSTVRTVQVTVGTQDPVRTQVTGQLMAGEKVVLADLDAAVPASNATTTGLTGLGGSSLGGGSGSGRSAFGGTTGGTGRG